MNYPAIFTKDDEGGFVVSFRDLPEALTQGDTFEEAKEMAEDVLFCAIEYYLDHQEKVPLPSSPKKGEILISLPTSVYAKVLLLNEMLEQKVKYTDMSKALGVTPAEITRLTSVKHTTKIDRIQKALSVLGKNLCLTLA